MNVEFSDTSDAIMCVADVISNLLYPPHILIMEGNNTISSSQGFSHTVDISNSGADTFTCSVCITVPEVGIVNHCSSSTVTLSNDGKLTYFMIVK